VIQPVFSIFHQTFFQIALTSNVDEATILINIKLGKKKYLETRQEHLYSFSVIFKPSSFFLGRKM